MPGSERPQEHPAPRYSSSAQQVIGAEGPTSEDTTTTTNNHNSRSHAKRRSECLGAADSVAETTARVSKRQRNRNVHEPEDSSLHESRSPSSTRSIQDDSAALRRADQRVSGDPQDLRDSGRTQCRQSKQKPSVRISLQDLDGNLEDAVNLLLVTDNGLEACAEFFKRIHSPDTFYRLSRYLAALHDVPSAMHPGHGADSLDARRASQLPRPVVLDRYLLSLCSLVECDIQARDDRKILYMWRCCEAFQHWNEVKDAFENKQHKDYSSMRRSIECYRQRVGNGSLVRNLSLLKAYIAFCMDYDWQEDEGDDACQHNKGGTWTKSWNIYMAVGGAVSAIVETFGIGILALTPYSR